MSPKKTVQKEPPELDEAFAVPLEDFTRTRDTLAKRLRDEGKSDEAKSIKALRKPSVPAWAVNQLARRNQGELEELFDAGAELRRAQQAILRGGSPGDLREATARERRAVSRLVELAASLLQQAGHAASQAYRERIADTLAATSADDEARDLVRSGRLQTELRRVGFADSGGLALVPTKLAGKSKTEARKRAEDERRQKAKERAARLDQKARALEDEAARFRDVAEEAERAARTALRRAEQADARAAKARGEANDASDETS